MTFDPLEAIPSFVALSEVLATAGQPSEEQLAAVAAAGFEVVINLGLHDDPNYSLKDEAATAASLGLDYVHIPVQFSAPTTQALTAYSKAMGRAGDRKVFVHCRHNKRVPVFVALDRILRQGWEAPAALSAMNAVWQPDATWQKFIDTILATTGVSPGSRVIVALDFEDGQQAMQLVEQLGDPASFYKIGLQLLTAEGPAVVRQLVAAGKQVFLDLKLLEIPNSVAGAVAAAGQLGVSMVTVHASGGSEVLRAAVKAARPFPKLKVLALTVITSMRDEDLEEVGVSGTVQAQVTRLAKLAIAAGCDGVVASPQEVHALREILPPDSLIVTPGVQLPGDAKSDQMRTATPAEAIRAGASHLVVGRSIARAPDPSAAFAAICDQFTQGRSRP